MPGTNDPAVPAASIPEQVDRSRYVRNFPHEVVDVTTLSLAQLRARRKELQAHESHVSYWRRIIQARLDLLEEGVVKHGASGDGLQRVLTQRLGVNNRLGLLSVQPQGGQPLAGLDHLWHRTLTASVDEQAELDAELREAEHELSTYRNELHQYIDEATAELIRRYRENPDLVATVLPHRSERPSPL